MSTSSLNTDAPLICTPADSSPSAWRRWWPFTRHYLEMLLAMAVGMAVLDPLWRLVLPGALDHDTTTALVMATDMSLGMGAWMRYRGHGRRAIGEMSAAMYLPFVVFFPVLWAGAMSGDSLVLAGHSLMLFAMLAVMLWRRDEYAGHHHAASYVNAPSDASAGEPNGDRPDARRDVPRSATP